MKKTYTEEVVFCAQYLSEKGITPEEYVTLATFDGYLPFKITRTEERDEFFEELAKKLRELWPPGDKIINGKAYAWRDSVQNLSKRLETLWSDRFKDKHYSIEECLSAARKYLAQFEDNVKYMQTLKFFIWKQKDLVMSNGQIKHISESKFADILEGNVELAAVDEEWNNILNSTSDDDFELI